MPPPRSPLCKPYSVRVTWVLFSLLVGIAVAICCTYADAPALSSHSSEADGAESPQPLAVPAAISAERDLWTRHCLEWVESVLEAHPPGSGRDDARMVALTTLDDPLHLEDAPRLPAIGDFFRRMVEKGIRQIESDSVSSGASIWKIYNHFFVVKTPNHTYAFDFCQGAGEAHLTEEHIARLVDEIEVLFISHRHADHADLSVARKMLSAGKPVVVPTELWQDEDISSALTRADGGDTGTLNDIAFTVFPGGQLDVPDNVYLVVADNVSVMHTGDQQQYGKPAEWLSTVGQQYDVDILLPNCWTPDLPDMIQSIDPQVVITGHENELYHPVWERESFTKSYWQLDSVTHRYVVMGWGERFQYQSVAPPQTSQ